MTPVSSEELVWALIQARLLDNDSEMRFLPDVTRYINSIFKREGVVTCPDFIKTFYKYKPDIEIENYDKKIEAQKQYRIKLHTIKNLDKIIKQVRNISGKDIREDVIEELDPLKEFLHIPKEDS